MALSFATSHFKFVACLLSENRAKPENFRGLINIRAMLPDRLMVGAPKAEHKARVGFG